MTPSDEVAGYDDLSNGARAEEPDDGAAHVPGASAPELKSLLGIAVGTLVVAALHLASDVLLPITLAVMLSFVLSPVVNFLQRRGLWRAPAVIVTVIAALSLLGVVGTLIGSQAASLSVNAPQYAQTVQHKIASAQAMVVSDFGSITKQFGGGKAAAPAGPAASIAPMPASGTAARSPVPVRVVAGSTSPYTLIRTVLAPILGPLETTVLVFIVAIFVLVQKEDLRDRFIRLFGSKDLNRTTRAMDDAGQKLSKYFLSQLTVNVCFGTVIGVGLWIIGIPSSAMWGLMAGLLRFVPYIGSLLAAVAPAALGAAIDPGWTMAIEVVALFFVVEPVTGYAVEPLLYGRSTGLSPISVIVAAIFWTWIWGPIGLIISTPLTLCLVVTGRHVKSLEFFDVLLGDRPALTPVETFYQRLLADNPDEALAQAEALLADRTLAAYYDEVVIPALTLAAADHALGAIDRIKAREMIASTLSVVKDLEDHVDPETGPVQPPSQATRTVRVACVAGRGPFDVVVTAMLAQLLHQAGFEARAIANGEVARNAVATLDLSGVDMIVIAFLEPAGARAELRYLVRRLRERARGTQILVGLWEPADVAMSDPDIQRNIGADAYVANLRNCLDVARAAATAPSQAA